MHLTGYGKRMYVLNSLLSTLDHSVRFYVRLVHVGPDGLKVDPFFNIDLNKLPTGPARGHDMLINMRRFTGEVMEPPLVMPYPRREVDMTGRRSSNLENRMEPEEYARSIETCLVSTHPTVALRSCPPN